MAFYEELLLSISGLATFFILYLILREFWTHKEIEQKQTNEPVSKKKNTMNSISALVENADEIAQQMTAMYNETFMALKQQNPNLTDEEIAKKPELIPIKSRLDQLRFVQEHRLIAQIGAPIADNLIKQIGDMLK